MLPELEVPSERIRVRRTDGACLVLLHQLLLLSDLLEVSGPAVLLWPDEPVSWRDSPFDLDNGWNSALQAGVRLADPGDAAGSSYSPRRGVSYFGVAVPGLRRLAVICLGLGNGPGWPPAAPGIVAGRLADPEAGAAFSSMTSDCCCLFVSSPTDPRVQAGGSAF